jgi:hypothetical protein
MVSDRFKRHTRRSLQRLGRPVTVRNYTDDGTTDAHGDPDRSLDAATQTDAILRQPTEERVVAGPDGQRVAMDVEIFLPADVTVHAADDDGGRYATEIEDSVDGAVYRAVAVWHEGNGQRRVAGVTQG